MSDQAAATSTQLAAAGSATPEIGAVVDTFGHGRQQVMDVVGLPYDEPTVFLRPERGGCEWTVPVSALGRVVRDA